MKKSLAVMLALIMVLALVPTVAFAEEALNTDETAQEDTAVLASANARGIFTSNIKIDAYEGKGFDFIEKNKLGVAFEYKGSQVGSGKSKVYILKDGKLTGKASGNTAKADPGIIIKDGIAYKFSHAGVLGNYNGLKEVYYNSSKEQWYYSYSSVRNIPVSDRGQINFVYDKTGDNTYILNYDANGGTDAPASERQVKKSLATASFTISDTIPTREGYKFLGWADSSNGTVKYKAGDGLTLTYTSDVTEKTIYAVWEEDIGPIPSPDPVALVGDITVKCVTAVDKHEEKQTTLIGGSYTVSPIVNNRATVKIESEEYVKFYNGQVTGVTHTITGDTEKTINIEYDAEQKMWVVVDENAIPVVFTVQHDVPMGDSGFVKVKKEFKGLPDGTFPKEALFKVKQGDKEIANIYVNQNNDWGANKTTQLLPGNYTVEEIINSDVQVEGYILTAPEAKDFTIVEGQITEVTFTNKYVEEPFPGVITVKKTVDSNVPADKDKEFKFKVTVLIPIDPNPDPSGPPNAKSANAVKAPAVRAVDKTATNKDFKQENNGDWTFYFTLKDGDTMTISNLPVGFTYRVEELDADGYTVTVNNKTTSSKDVGLTKENPTETLNFKNTRGSTPTPTPTPYNGGGHGHYHPSATPVPVIVIPPKTGDMTIWQSILHFLGII